MLFESPKKKERKKERKGGNVFPSAFPNFNADNQQTFFRRSSDFCPFDQFFSRKGEKRRERQRKKEDFRTKAFFLLQLLVASPALYWVFLVARFFSPTDLRVGGKQGDILFPDIFVHFFP